MGTEPGFLHTWPMRWSNCGPPTSAVARKPPLTEVPIRLSARPAGWTSVAPLGGEPTLASGTSISTVPRGPGVNLPETESFVLKFCVLPVLSTVPSLYVTSPVAAATSALAKYVTPLKDQVM